MQYLSAFFDLYLFDLYTRGALRTDNLPAGSLIHAESRKFSVQFLSRPRHWSAFQTPNLYLSMWAESLYLYNIGLRETLVKGEMHDQRVEARPLLGGKDPGDGVRVCRIAAQAVDGLGRPAISCSRIEYLQLFRLRRLKQPVIRADKRECLNGDRAEHEASCQLDGVVSAQGIAVNHLQRGVDHGIVDHLSDKSGLQVALHGFENGSGDAGGDVAGALTAPDRRTDLDHRDCQNSKPISWLITKERQEPIRARLLHV